jgi:NAD-dependent protein deacetylase/lipoamidase
VSAVFSDRFASRLALAQSLVAFTGAGISAESGVPTFRGADGIWKKMHPDELASMEGFLKNPSLVWEWYAHRRTIIGGVQPNAGHRALVELEGLFPVFALVTQNIDNLHQRAGSMVVHELHGNIERNYCMQCGAQYRDTEVPLRDGQPVCSRCRGLVRPDVVWFGEMLPEDEWNAAVRAAETTDCFLSIGTSALVYPAASLPLIARRQGAFLVEVNPEPTPLTERADEFLQGPAGSVLPELVDFVRRVRGRRKTEGGRE